MEERIIKDVNNLLTQLFQKMKEAGYEWDSEKKELKKIDKKAMSDKEKAHQIAWETSKHYDPLLSKESWCEMAAIDMASWKNEQKPAWSEEDEKILNSLISSIARIGANTRTDSTSINYTFSREIDWLKSLRPQKKWKLGKRYEDALLWCIAHLGGADKQTLAELLEQLKAL